jgi:hypothetical protein
VHLGRWWAPNVAPEATPWAFGGVPEAVSGRLRRRLIRASQGGASGAASGVGNVVGLAVVRVDGHSSQGHLKAYRTDPLRWGHAHLGARKREGNGHLTPTLDMGSAASSCWSDVESQSRVSVDQWDCGGALCQCFHCCWILQSWVTHLQAAYSTTDGSLATSGGGLVGRGWT